MRHLSLIGLRLNQLLAFGVAFFAFCSFNPYFLWGFEFSGYLKLAVDVVFVVFACFVVVIHGINKKFFLLFPVLLIWSFVRFGSPVSFDWAIVFFSWFIKIAFFACLPASVLRDSSSYFSALLSFFGFFSLLAFLQLAFLGDVFYRFELINPYPLKVEMGQVYAGFFGGSYFPYLVECNGVCVARMNGAFDEPGLWGTVCALYLAAKRFDLKGTGSKIIFVSGLVTFSLAFFILSLISILFIKRVLSYLWMFFLLSGLLYLINPDYFQELLLSRINLDHLLFQRGASDLLLTYLSSDYYRYLFGYGFASSLREGLGASSWVVHLYEGGLVLIFATLAFYFIGYRLYNQSFSNLSFVPVVFLSYLQRPEIVWAGVFYIFLLSLYVVDTRNYRE